MTAKRPGDRVFGLVLSGLFALIAIVALFLSGRLPLWAVATSAAALLLALAAPGLLMPLNRLWSRVGRRVAVVSNYLLLGAFYFLVVVPFGLAARLLRLIALHKRPDPAAETYWTPVGRQATADTYPDLF